MNYCKSNIRRVINYQLQEPLNKYDLWLSENLRYNEDGELVYDNPGQPACDLILKIFRNGKWEPIVGSNTTAGNKINVVVNSPAYTLYNANGELYTSNASYQEGHMPLFRKPDHSPLELFDGGTVGNVLKNFVTENEWGDIYETYIKEFIIDDPDNPWNGDEYELGPALVNKLGGIYANTFSISYNEPSDHTARDTYHIPCKYAYNNQNPLTGQADDYNIYVHVYDVYNSLQKYFTDYPLIGLFDWRLATHELIGGIKAAIDPNSDDDCRNIPIVLAGPNAGSIWGLQFGSGMYPLNKYPGDTDPYNEFLYLPGWALRQWLIDPYLTPGVNEPFIHGWKGVSVLSVSTGGSPGLYIGLEGLQEAQVGYMPRKTGSGTSSSIEWIECTPGQSYESLNGSTCTIPGDYVIHVPSGSGGTGGSSFVLNGVGGWSKLWQYVAGDGISRTQGDNSYIFSIDVDGARDGYVLTYNNGSVSWEELTGGGEPIEYTEGIGIDIDDNEINIAGVTDGNKGKYLRVNSSGDNVEWDSISPGTTYSEGVGIKIDSSNYININTDGAIDGQVLSYNDTLHNVEWVDQLGEEYADGDGIEINTETTPKKINAKISYCDDADSNTFIVDLNLLIRTSSEAGKNVIVVSHDSVSQEDLNVKPFTYLNIPFSDTPSTTSGKITFSVSYQTTIMDGDPVYFILSIPKGIYSSIEVSVENGSLNEIHDYIYLDDCVYLNSGSNYLDLSAGNGNAFKFLVTVLFGIVKIEKLGVVTSAQTPI